MLFAMLSDIVGYLIYIIIVLVIVQFVLSLLVAFNVVNMRNQWVSSIWRSINALLDPLLRPIRRLLPDTGAIDFSPLVLIVLLNIVNIIFARLEQVFGSYKELRLAWTEPVIEGAAGSLYCTVSGKLTDAQDPARPPIEDTLTLKRVNDVPGATPDQLRWTMRESTFVERLERSDGRKP